MRRDDQLASPQINDISSHPGVRMSEALPLLHLGSGAQSPQLPNRTLIAQKCNATVSPMTEELIRILSAGEPKTT